MRSSTSGMMGEVAPGIFVSPDFLVSLAAQAHVQVAPRLEISGLPDTRVDSIRWLGGDPARIVLTTENDMALRIYDEDGNKLKKLGSLHRGDGAEWNPNLIREHAGQGLVITDGGATALRVIDIHAQKAVGKLAFAPHSGRKLSDDDAGPILSEFHPSGASILVLSPNGDLNIWARDSRSKNFKLNAKAILGIPKMLGIFAPTEPIVSAKLSSDGEDLWVAFESGVISVYPTRGLPGWESPLANRPPRSRLLADAAKAPSQAIATRAPGEFVLVPSSRAYLPGGGLIAQIELSPDEKTAWFLIEERSGKMRDKLDRYYVDPSKVNLIGLDAASGRTSVWKDGVALGSKISGFYPLRDRLILVSDSPQSAVIFLNEQGHLISQWTMERSPDKHYLSSSSGPNDPVHAHAISPDRSLFATSHDGGALALWDPRTGALLAVVETGAIDLRGLAFSPDSQLIAIGGHGGEAKVYGVRDLIDQAGIAKRVPTNR